MLRPEDQEQMPWIQSNTKLRHTHPNQTCQQISQDQMLHNQRGPAPTFVTPTNVHEPALPSSASCPVMLMLLGPKLMEDLLMATTKSATKQVGNKPTPKPSPAQCLLLARTGQLGLLSCHLQNTLAMIKVHNPSGKISCKQPMPWRKQVVSKYALRSPSKCWHGLVANSKTLRPNQPFQS